MIAKRFWQHITIKFIVFVRTFYTLCRCDYAANKRYLLYGEVDFHSYNSNKYCNNKPIALLADCKGIFNPRSAKQSNRSDSSLFSDKEF